MQKGVHPKLIAKGSSGSYFARDGDGRVVASVPLLSSLTHLSLLLYSHRNLETPTSTYSSLSSNTQCIQTKGRGARSFPRFSLPSSDVSDPFSPLPFLQYGRLNPKWTKWVHRNFFSWIGWGRACLIPNLSYVSEAAASELDRRMNNLGMVPRTELVSLSSPSFFYDWIDRNAYAKKKKPLREKVGSFQVTSLSHFSSSLVLDALVKLTDFCLRRSLLRRSCTATKTRRNGYVPSLALRISLCVRD